MLLERQFAAEFLGEVARSVAECGAFFYGGKDVEGRCCEEEDMTLIITLELLADIFGYGGVSCIAEVEDFVGTLTAADTWDSIRAMDRRGLGVAALRGGVVVEVGGRMGGAGGVVLEHGVGRLMTREGLWNWGWGS